MKRIIGSPLRYIQGPGEIKNLYKHLKDWGKNFFIIIGPNSAKVVLDDVKQSFKKHKGKVVITTFGGDSTINHINNLVNQVNKSQCDCVIGIGGGKCADATKAVASKTKSNCVIVPTSTSCDAFCAHSAVLYNDKHEFQSVYYPYKSPDLVIVDSTIIANSPLRLFKAGIGDALSTYIEARTAWRSGREINEWKGAPSLSSYELAKLCYETILKQGFKACIACENKVVTQALEDVIEANIFLSTIGFESSGLGAAHSIQVGLCTIPEVEKYYHGEVVAFGSLAALVLENASIEKINKVLQFLYSIGLPMCLEDIGIKNSSKQLLKKVAVVSAVNNIHMYKMPFKVTPEMVEAAIIVADKFGKYFKDHGKLPGGLNDFGKDCRCNLKNKR